MKVAVIGPNFFSYNEMISRAFCAIGADCVNIKYPTIPPSHVRTLQMRVAESIMPARTAQDYRNFLNRMELRSFYGVVTDILSSFDPDLVLFLKGEIFSKNFIKRLRERTHAPFVVWAYDSARRYNSIKRIGPGFDLVYTFEPSDVGYLSSSSVTARFLPLAYDETLYHPLENRQVEQDLCFIGRISGYARRKRELEQVAKRFTGERVMKVWGRTYNNRLQRQFYKQHYRALFPCLMNENVPPERINEIYNHTGISLNIHHGQSVNGLNPRTFEILGSGGFQIVDHKSALIDLFEPEKEIVSYRNVGELIEKIEYFLIEDRERERISDRGHERAVREHRFENRMREILSHLREEGKL